MKLKDQGSLLLLAGCLILPLLVGFIGSIFTLSSIPSWYVTLNKPWFTPPNWLFGPAWTILYLLMGFSLWLVIRNGISGSGVRLAVTVFSAQLIVNLIWSLVFFGLRSMIGGLISVIVLLLLIIATILAFHRVSKKAAYLLVPYFCWTCFATALNLMIILLN